MQCKINHCENSFIIITQEKVSVLVLGVLLWAVCNYWDYNCKDCSFKRLGVIYAAAAYKLVELNLDRHVTQQVHCLNRAMLLWVVLRDVSGEFFFFFSSSRVWILHLYLIINSDDYLIITIDYTVTVMNWYAVQAYVVYIITI